MIKEQLEQALDNLEMRYQKLGILVVSKNQQILLSSDFDYLSVNLPLSEFLKNKINRTWSICASDFLMNRIQNSEQNIVVIDYFDLLMNPDVGINAFDLFKQLSKNKIIIVVWRYQIEGKILIYGKVGHDEYQKIELSDALFIQYGGENVI